MKRDKEDPIWKIAPDCLTYYNQEEDKKRYIKAKKFYLKKILEESKESEKLEEIEDYSEEQVDELLKKSPPLKAVDNHFYCFVTLLNLGQCAFNPEILEFFNKKDFSIYSLYKFAPRYVFQLLETYEGSFSFKYKKLSDLHFLLYCNIIDYFEHSYLMLNKKMKDYIELTKDKLILLGFTEDEIIERQAIIEDIKKNEGSIFSSVYNYFFPKKEESQEVKIKYS
jgi:hypothetical protein